MNKRLVKTTIYCNSKRKISTMLERSYQFPEFLLVKGDLSLQLYIITVLPRFS